MERILKSLAVGLMLSTAPAAWAQTDTTTSSDSTEAATAETENADLLTQAELENLVAPIALYPDTLLIQVLVAATYPLEIVKANEFVKANADLEQAALETAINAEGYDESVAVLATAFPEVLLNMTAHIDWTDTIGAAMLAQSDDLLVAVQTMRNQAINTGALMSGDEQTVSVDEGEIVIQPADPQVVYVPQYNTETVYVQDNSNDDLTNVLLFFGTAILINNIFDNNNHWHGYWGCRNCAGWGGRPIYRNPRVDINVDGNVNIGNDIKIGGGDRGPGGSWKPEPKRQKDAREKISNKRGPDGAAKLPANRPNSRGDDMRKQLSNKTGAADISRDRSKIPSARPDVNRPSARPGAPKRDAISQTNRKASSNKAPVRKPSAKPATRKPAAKPQTRHKPSAMKQRAPAQRSRSGSSRGRSSGGGGRGRR